MEIIQTKVEVTQNDCEEMMRHNPATKFGYRLLILSFPIPGIYAYNSAKDDNVIRATDAEHLANLNSNSLMVSIIFSFIWLAIIYFSRKYAEKHFGNVLYKVHKKKNAMFLNIRFNKDTRKFIFSGKEQKKYKNYSKIKIISTPNNYIFYIGKGLYPGKIFLPKNGDDSQKLVVNEIIDILSKKEKIPVETRKK